MREIKFRAWDIDLKEFVLNTVRLCNTEEGNSLVVTGVADWGIVFQQFTGLKDKNGKEIFEGDILEFVYLNNGCPRKERVSVEFDGLNFMISSRQYLSVIFFFGGGLNSIDKRSGIKLIGNIYENPELLEEYVKDSEGVENG